MKKLLAIFVSIFIFFLFPLNIFAQENNVTVEKGKVINQNPYIVAGDNIDISGVVNGDVFAGAGKITVSGKINGDLIAGAGQVNISGEVTQNVRLGAGQVNISGKIGKNLLISSGDLEIAKTAIISGYLLSGAGNISIFAPMGGNVTVGTGNVSIYSNINGNLKAASDQITLSPDTSIKGDFEYWSNNNPNLDAKTKILGKTIKHDLPQNTKTAFPKMDATKIAGGFVGFAIGVKILSFISLLLIGFLMIKLYPNFMGQVEDNISKNFWKAVLTGFLVMIIFPISFIVLLVTVIGIPVAFILAAIYGIYIYLSKIFVIYWLGNKILVNNKSKYLSFFIASLIYVVLLIVPPISGIIKLIITLIGFGALVLSVKEGYLKAKTNKIV